MDPFEEMLQNRDKAGALRSSVSFGVTQNPDAYAKAYKLASKSGARPQAVLENGTAFENAGKLNEFDFDGFIRNTPRLASWASVPDNAAQAHDDFPVLQHLEEVASQILQVPQRAMGSLISSIGGSQRVLGSLADQARKPNSSLMSKIVGYGLLPGAALNPEVGTAMRQAGEDVQRYYEPLFTDPALQAETRSGKVTGFVGGIAGAFGKAMLANVGAPLLFGAEAFGAKGGQALDTGATPNQALVEATGSGALNTALGILPGGKQGQSLVRAAATRVGRGVVLGAGVTVGENLLTRIHDAKVPLTQGMAENIVNFLGMEAAGAYHEHLNKMATASAESKLRERAPEKFKEVISEITKDSPVENVLVPAEAFQRYFQSKGLDPAQVAESVGARNYVEALAAGTDVVIPSPDYLAHLAPEHHEGLKADLRFKASELSPRELEAYRQESMKVESEIMDQGAGAIKDAQDPAFQAIKEDTLRQLVAAGDDPNVAETRATIHAQAMKTMAERAGIDPITLHEAYNLRITRPAPGEAGNIIDRAVGRMAEPSVDAVLWQTSDLAARGEKPTLKDAGVGNEQASAQDQGVLPGSREVSGPDAGAVQRDLRPIWDPSTRTWRGSDQLGPEPGRWQGKLSELAPDPKLQDYQRRNIPVLNINGVDIAGGPRPPYFSFHGNAEATGAPGYSKGQVSKAGDGIYVARDHSDASVYAGPKGQNHAIYVDTSKLVSFDARSARSYSPQELAAFGIEGDRPMNGAQVLRHLVEALKSESNPYGGGEAITEHLRSMGFNGVAFDLGADGKPAWNLFDPRVIKRFTDATGWSPEEVARRQAFDPEPLGAGGRQIEDNPTYFQEGPKGFDFGSKEWNDYYLGRNKDGARGIGDRAKRARAAYEKALSKGGENAELDRRAAELQAAVDAETEAFANFDAEVKALQAGEVYAEGGDKQGFIQFGNDRKIQIGFLEKANLSTFTHETGHMYVEILHDLAARPNAPEQIKADLAKLRKFVGAEGDAPLTVEQHETLARANEAYLMEGKAPSEALRGVFQRVKFWMMNVYRNITGLGVKLNDDVRGVFDRLYASDVEIERARQDLGSDRQLFAKPEDMGVTQAEFDLYAKAKMKEIQGAKDALASRMMREVKRERESWWKEESAKVREEVAAEVDADAVYVAFKALADGKLPDGTPIKLSKEALIQEFGEGVVKELPRSFQRLYARQGGMDASTAAEFLGIRSGEALVEALKGMEPRKERIERLTQERMKAKHGDLTAPAAIAEAAMEEIHSDQRGEVLATELKALREQQKKMQPAQDLQNAKDQAKAEAFWRRGVVAEVPPLDTFKKAAVELVEGQRTMDLDPYRYLQGQRKASREAFEALAKGDYATAADAKQKELLNHFLFREATKAKEEVASAYDYARKFGKTSVRQRIGKAQGGYLEQIDGLLERFQFVAESKRDILARQESLSEFAMREGTNGEEIIIDPALFSDRPKNYRELTLPELRAVKDAIRNIETVARRQVEFLQDGKRVAFEDAIQEMDASARAAAVRIKPLEVDPLTKGVAEKTKDWFLHKDAMLLKLEQMVEWLDGGDINGPWAKYLFEPIAKAQAKEYALQEKVTAKMAENLEQMPKEQRLSMLDTFDIPGIGLVTRKWILSMAFNMGNEENQTKLLKGHGWADPKGMEAVGKALDKLNRADWEFVQRTWDTINELWPQIADLERRMTGIEPEKVQARPFTVTLDDGSTLGLQGGYYPLMYDSARSTQGAMQQTGDLAGLFEKGYARATTNKGHTKERTQFSAPLVLDFEQVLTSHTAKVIKDLTHREAVLAVNKLITNQTVRNAIQETLGPAYEAQFLPWLRGVVNDRNASASQGLGDFNKTMMTLRSNVAAATLGFKVSSVLVQATDLMRAADRVPRVELAKAFLDFVRHPQQVTEQVRGLSEEMRFRADNIDRDMRSALQNLQGKTGAYKEVQEFAFHGLGMADSITSVTTWLGAYRSELAKGIPEEQAIRQADRTVRLLLQAGNPKDLPAIQRQDGLAKFVTMFMGDASATYGLLRDASHQLRGEGTAPQFAARVVFGALLPAIVGDLIKQRGPGTSADDPDKAKKWAQWMAMKSLLAAPASVPILRDVANVIDNGMDYRFTPAASGLQKAGKLMLTTGKVLDGKSDQLPAMAFQAADVFGTLGGIPGTAQILTSGKYLYNVHTGKENPENAFEAVKNTVMGKNPQEKKR